LGEVLMNKIVYIFILVALKVFLGFLIFYPIFNFPKPKGPYGVGQIKYHWIDSSRKELNSQDPAHPSREIMAYVFYPTEKNNAAKPVVLDSDAISSFTDFFTGACHLPAFLFSSLKFIKTYAQPDVSIIKNTTKYPVVIFSHGGGPMVLQYTYILEELASRGFVVIGINHPYVAAIVRYPDGRVVKSIYHKKGPDSKQRKLDQLEANALDASFVLDKINEMVTEKDEFWNHVDQDKIGMFGHSFGGATTLRATRKDARIKCGISMDGGVHGEDIDNSFTTPFMFMLAGKSHLLGNEEYLEDISRLALMNAANMKMVTIEGVGHSIFSDTPILLSATLFNCLMARWHNEFLVLPAGEAKDVLVEKIMPKVVNFFEEHLLR